MAYNIPIPFNPRSNFSFDPSSFKNNTSGNNSPTSVSDNPYNPTCNNQNQTMIENHHQLIRSYANQYGQTISYQPVKYNFNTHNFLYGEDPISGFHYSRKLKAIIDFSAYTSFLTKFGIMSDAEMTIYIPIREFENVWGPSKGTVYPLAGDIFIVDNSACDRPLGQTPMCWQVTDKDDNLKPVDYMGRHFYWKLVCKRFDYSYEPNATPERFLDDETSDSHPYGRLPGGDNPTELGGKEYDVDDFSRSEFDNSKHDSTYGQYL
jgi:hypothetical protein